MKKFTMMITLGVGMLLGGAVKGQSFVENFETFTGGNGLDLPTGWDTSNVSLPLGATGWFHGGAAVFPAYWDTAYAGANFNNTTGTGTISDWLAAPVRWMHNGDMIEFYTRTVDSGTNNYADRLQVWLSLQGSNTQFPLNENTTGSYTVKLLDIDSTYSVNSYAGGYPYNWKKYTLTLSGLATNGQSCRFAFRYYVQNGGPTGANSNYIGVDSVAYITTFSGINDHNEAVNFGFYPNPTKGSVRVFVGEKNIEERTVMVCDILGNTVFQKVYNSNEFDLDLGQLDAGVYFLNIRNDKGMSSKKLVIEK
ncbi:MAG TPA: choice-of-anchor J domain-containing protein [Bacteroidia bacterium]|jgi:hypothetical protein